MQQATKLKAAVLLSCTESSCIEGSMSSNTQIFLDVHTDRFGDVGSEVYDLVVEVALQYIQAFMWF